MSDSTKALKAILSDGTIAFHAIFAKAFRSLPIGVFLSQGFFWQENAKFRSEKTHRTIEGKTFFTKTAKEWFEETALTQEQQTQVRGVLGKSGVLFERLAGSPAKLFFHIDFELLVSVINRYLETGHPVLVDNRSKNRFKTKTSLGKVPNQDLVENPTLVSVKNQNSIIESFESFESEGDRTPTPAPKPSNLKAEKKRPNWVRVGCQAEYGEVLKPR